MSQLTSTHIIIGRCASFLGILQGVAWFIMALLCIVEYNINNPPDYGDSYMEHFNYRLYFMYLYRDANLPSGTIVTPTVFIVFMCLHLVLSLIWVTASLFQINVIKKQSMNVPIFFKDWALIAWIISVLDFLLVILLSCDYNLNCLENFGDEFCINTIIPVIVLTARGFILWIINVLVAWKLFADAKLLRQGGSYEGTFGGVIPSVSQIPRAAIPTTPNVYAEQQRTLNSNKTFWNVNLRTAMENRTPPATPATPTGNNSTFFNRY